MVVDKEAARIRRMFATISPRYDLLNHLLSFNIDKVWRRRTVSELRLSSGAHVLDICTGTADLALELTRVVDASRGGGVYGADFTAEMVRIGAEKRRALALEQPFLCVADALRLPFASKSFDAVTVAFGIRNVASLERGLGEMWRVLKPSGQIAILDFSTPRSQLLRAIYQVYFHFLLPRIGGWISRSRAAKEAYRYLPESVAEFPPPEELSRILRRLRFEGVRFRRFTCGVAILHLARRPAPPRSTNDEKRHDNTTTPPASPPPRGHPA